VSVVPVREGHNGQWQYLAGLTGSSRYGSHIRSSPWAVFHPIEECHFNVAKRVTKCPSA